MAASDELTAGRRSPQRSWLVRLLERLAYSLRRWL